MFEALANLARGAREARPFAAEPLFGATGILLALTLIVTVPALALDDRVLRGENVWIKPIRFQIALSVYFLTLAYFARWLPAGMTQGLVYRRFAYVIVAAVVAEIVWIAGAAALGVGSHYNVSAPATAWLYSAMGVAAVMLTSASLVYGIAIWRAPAWKKNDPVRQAVALGLVLTFVLTVPIAGYLSAFAPADVKSAGVQVPEADAIETALGWSRPAGGLRTAHFLATHALHFLPLLGLALAFVTSAARARLAIRAGAVAYAALVVAVFAAAIVGERAVTTPASQKGGMQGALAPQHAAPAR